MISDDVWKALERIESGFSQGTHEGFMSDISVVTNAIPDILAELRKSHTVDARAQMFQAGKARV